MDRDLEQDMARMLEIATTIIEEGRKPTEEERARFLALHAHIEGQPLPWRERVADQIDRLAAVFESMGL